jgi:hypothetical protein
MAIPDPQQSEEGSQPFGMPFTNHEVAVIVASELNRHDRGLWFYAVEGPIAVKRWIIVRNPRDLPRVCGHEIAQDSHLVRLG